MSISSTDESIEIMLTKFLCDNITAFGVPVVPEVKISDAIAFEWIFAGSKAFRFASSVSDWISKTSSNVQTTGAELPSLDKEGWPPLRRTGWFSRSGAKLLRVSETSAPSSAWTKKSPKSS